MLVKMYKNVINCTLINSSVDLPELALNDHLKTTNCRNFKILDRKYLEE